MKLIPLVLLSSMIGALALGCSPREDSTGFDTSIGFPSEENPETLAEQLSDLDPIDGCTKEANREHYLTYLQKDFRASYDVLLNSCDQTYRVVAEQTVMAYLLEDWSAVVEHAETARGLAVSDEEKEDSFQRLVIAYFYSGVDANVDGHVEKSDLLLEERLNEVPTDIDAIELRMVVNTYLENFEVAIAMANQGIESPDYSEHFEERLEDIKSYQETGVKPYWLPS